MKVSNLTNNNGNKIANQFEIIDGDNRLFQSYDSIIVKQYNGKVYLDATYWNYSKTTSKYRSQFLNETTKETQAKIDSGEYTLMDLN